MKALSDQCPETAMQFLGHELAGVSDSTALLSAVCELISRLIPCDDVIWHSADVQSWDATFRGLGTNRYGPEVGQRLLEATDNPVRRHYLSGADPSGRPVRIGDVSTDWQFRNSRAWADLYRPLGIARQLTIPTGFNAQSGSEATATRVTGGTAWSLNRDGSEFSDDDLSVAIMLQPVLKATETSAIWHPGSSEWRETFDDWKVHPEPCPISSQKLQAGPCPALTRRELEVLSLVAEGFTAISIGFRLQISGATVRKHLEHIYEKTGQRDRLLAVAYARRMGLLPDN